MSTLHGRLLAEIDTPYEVWAPPNAAPRLADRRRALRAVAALHAPEFFGGFMACLACSPGMPPQVLIDAPCPTIRAIAESLGVPTEEKTT